MFPAARVVAILLGEDIMPNDDEHPLARFSDEEIGKMSDEELAKLSDDEDAEVDPKHAEAIRAACLLNIPSLLAAMKLVDMALPRKYRPSKSGFEKMFAAATPMVDGMDQTCLWTGGTYYVYLFPNMKAARAVDMGEGDNECLATVPQGVIGVVLV